MILITGATGQLGRHVVDALLDRVPADNIVAAVRRPAAAADLQARGVQVRPADYERPGQWPAALEGVSKVLLIATSDLANRVRHHRVVVDAVEAHGGIDLLAFTSMLHVETSTYMHADSDRIIEQAILDSGVRSTFLRHSWYTENYTDLAPYAAADGKLYGAAGNASIHAATRADYAAAAAHVLTTDQPLRQRYELAGDEGFTLPQVAAEIARQSGAPVQYIDTPEPDLAAHLASIGYPKDVAATLANADAVAAKGELVDHGHDLSTLISRPTTPLSHAVRGALSAGSAPQ